MAQNQPSSAIAVINSDTINIPEPGIITSGTNTSGAATTLVDAGQDFLNPATNLNGYNIKGGDVVISAAGAICEIESVDQTDKTRLNLKTPGIAAGAYEIYNGNYNVSGKSDGFSLYVTGAGNLSVVTVFGNTIVIPVTANSFLDLQVIKVNATGTTATGIIALQIQD